MSVSGPHDPRHTPGSTAQEPPEVAEAARRHINRSPWNWLLLVPLVAVLIPQIYNRDEPRLFDIPFFYWYQLAAIAIGVTCTVVVYRMTKGER